MAGWEKTAVKAMEEADMKKNFLYKLLREYEFTQNTKG